MTHQTPKNLLKAAIQTAMIATLIVPASAFAKVDTMTTDTDMSQYQTYRWVQDAKPLSPAAQAIRDAANRELTAKGFVEVTENADFEAQSQTKTWTEVRVDSHPPLTLRPRVSRWAFFHDIEVVEVWEVEKGLLEIRLTDTDTGDLVWQGTAEGTPRAKLKKNIARIDKVTAKMFADLAGPIAAAD